MASAYNNIVKNLLNIPHIREYVQTEANDGQFLNLITPDWEKRLNEHEVFQQHVKDTNADLFFTVTKNSQFEKQLIKYQEHKIYIMVALPCRISSISLVNFFTVFSIESKPLSIIAEALTSDKVNDYNLVKNFKFRLPMCNNTKCNHCKLCFKKFKKLGYSIGSNNPCICKTWIYDGNQIVSRFASTIQSEFKARSFMAIMQVEIDMRIMYCSKPSNIRIGGNIIKILVMEENLLTNIKIMEPFLGEIKPHKSKREQSDNEKNGKRKQKEVQNDKPKKKKPQITFNDDDCFTQVFNDLEQEEKEYKLNKTKQSKK